MSDAGNPLPVGDADNNPDPDLLTGNIFDLSDKSHGEDAGILKTLLTNVIQNIEKDQPNYAITLFLEKYGTETFSQFVLMEVKNCSNLIESLAIKVL